MLTKKRKYELENDELSKNIDTINLDDDSDYSDYSDNTDDDLFDLDAEINKRRKVDKHGFKVLADVKKTIEATEPNLEILIRTPMSLEDRVKLVHQYDIYRQQIPRTMEWSAMRDLYLSMFKEYTANYQETLGYTKKQIQELEKLENELKSTCNYSTSSLKHKILTLNADTTTKKIIYEHYEEFCRYKTNGDDYNKKKQWLKWATSMPYKNEPTITPKNIKEFIYKCKEKLDSELYGMEKVKEQLLVYISTKLQNPDLSRSNLALVGPPGVGKTKIARLIATLLGWGFEHISLGGISKLSFLRGFEYTYAGSEPGIIAKSLSRIGHTHGIILLDEMDKISDNPDISSFLLHVTDSSQNYNFRDTYLADIPINLSKIWFIASMNTKNIDKVLLDRFWVIDVDGYTRREQSDIVNLYTLPKILKSMLIDKTHIKFADHVVSYIIDRYINRDDKGVRSLEKLTEIIVDRVNFLITHQDDAGKLSFNTSFMVGGRLDYPLVITKDLVEKLLSNIKVERELSYIM